MCTITSYQQYFMTGRRIPKGGKSRVNVSGVVSNGTGTWEVRLDGASGTQPGSWRTWAEAECFEVWNVSSKAKGAIKVLQALTSSHIRLLSPLGEWFCEKPFVLFAVPVFSSLNLKSVSYPLTSKVPLNLGEWTSHFVFVYYCFYPPKIFIMSQIDGSKIRFSSCGFIIWDIAWAAWSFWEAQFKRPTTTGDKWDRVTQCPPLYRFPVFHGRLDNMMPLRFLRYWRVGARDSMSMLDSNIWQLGEEPRRFQPLQLSRISFNYQMSLAY